MQIHSCALALLPLAPAQYGQYGTYRETAFVQQSGDVAIVAGDYDGDGFADIVTRIDSKGDERGTLSVLSGAGLGELARIECPEGLLGWGRSLATLEDVDGDGHRDLLVGAHGNLRAERYTGPFGDQTTGEFRGAVVALGSAGWRVLSTVSPPTAGVGFGSSVAVAPDIDGDGTGDYFVGAAGDSPMLKGSGRSGMAYACSGATGDLIWSRAPSREEWLRTFARSLSVIDDVSGDGRADVLIGNAPDSRSTGVTALCGRTGSILWENFYPTPLAGSRTIWGVATNLRCNTDAVPDCAVFMEVRGAGVHTLELLLLNGADGVEVRRITIPTYSLADGPRALSRLGEQLVLLGVSQEGGSPVLVDLATQQLRSLWQTSPLPAGSRAVGTCAAAFERAGEPWYFVGARGGNLRAPVQGNATSVPVGYLGRLDGTAPVVTLSLPASVN